MSNESGLPVALFHQVVEVFLDGDTVDGEIFIEGKYCADVKLFGCQDKCSICEIHRKIGILVLQFNDAMQVVSFELKQLRASDGDPSQEIHFGFKMNLLFE